MKGKCHQKKVITLKIYSFEARIEESMVKDK